MTESKLVASFECAACSYSYMEPDDTHLVCGHPDSGPLGLYVHRATERRGHCGPERSKFEQHPLRLPDGRLRSQ